MALLRVNLSENGLELHEGGGDPGPTLTAQADGSGPIIVMIHGFKFAPGDPVHCPHDHILSLARNHACWKAKSWPRELGLDRDDRLGIAFGWPARGSIWQAYERAEAAGLALADLIRHLHRAAPHRPVHAIAHSLGARVVLSALPHLPPGALNRAILLAGAEYAGRAEAALDSAAGRKVEVISVTSRENRLYDRLLESVIPPPERGDLSLGRRALDRPNWLTLPIDRPDLLAGLAAQGFRIAGPERRICHWSAYLRPGVFGLYAALVAEPTPLPLTGLQRLVATDPSPLPAARRRYRLPQISVPLPLMRNASS